VKPVDGRLVTKVVNMKLLATYGTLRKGHYNNYLLRNSELLGENILPNFTMFRLSGNYPAIVPSINQLITVEVYRITEKVYKKIEQLELPYNYHAETITTEFGVATIYVYNTIESGDWNKQSKRRL